MPLADSFPGASALSVVNIKRTAAMSYHDPIRPPYRADDDVPFGGRRWGCFWTTVLLLLAFATLSIGRILINFSDMEWLPWIVYLAGFVILIWALWRRGNRESSLPWWIRWW